MNSAVKKKIIIAVLFGAFLVTVFFIFLYNQGFLGYKDYGYCFREGQHNNWFFKNRGFGHGHHQGRFGGGEHGFGLLTAVIIFVLIIGSYIVFRYLKDSKKITETGLKCENCKSEINKEWKTCPFCGHKQ
jgi:hypothetical protein